LPPFHALKERFVDLGTSGKRQEERGNNNQKLSPDICPESMSAAILKQRPGVEHGSRHRIV
jgi:hypothetical protein